MTIRVRKPQGADRIIVESGGAIRIQPGGVITLGANTPVNAAASSAVLAAADLAIAGNGDKVRFLGVDYEKAAVPAGNQWADAAGLAALLDALVPWNAGEAAGAVTITAATRGVAGDGYALTLEVIEDTTAGGDGAGTEAAATIAAASIARLAMGDTVTFAGSMFTKAAATSVPDNEFADQAGLIACIDAMADWTAADNAGAIDITAATDAVDFNGEEIVLNLHRVTAGGVDGTIGQAGDTYVDASFLYVASADNTISDNNWRRIALGNAY